MRYTKRFKKLIILGIINFQSNRPLIDVNLSRVFPNAPSDPTIPPRSLSTEKSHCHLYIPKEKSNQSSSANLERGLRLSCDGGEENCPNLSMYLTYHDHRRGEFLAGKMHGKNLAFSRLDAIFAQHLEKLNSVFLIATKINPLSSTHSARDVQNKSTRILRDYGVEHKTFSCSSKISMESPQSKLSLSTASGLLGFQTLSKGFKITDRARLSLGGELFYNPMETGVGGC